MPWWRTDHAYLDDVEILELGEVGGENECSTSTKFPDSISAAASAVMGEYGYIPRLGETEIFLGFVNPSSHVVIHAMYSKTRFGCLNIALA